MTKIFGIINITPDSFSDGGEYFDSDKVVKRINELFLGGADFVDIGAQATSYGAEVLTPKQEWRRLEPVLNSIQDPQRISVDTYHYENMVKAYGLGFKMFNDVKGGQKSEVLKFIASHPDTTYISMYSLTIPADKNVRVKTIKEINEWAEHFINQCKSHKIRLEQIVIDPGIGFTTNPEQSFEVIKNISKLREFGVKTLIGHSRKSFLEEISKLPPSDRDLETTVASLYMYDKVDYIRVHNVEMHRRTFNVWKRLY